jgi:hypothetical protein
VGAGRGEEEGEETKPKKEEGGDQINLKVKDQVRVLPYGV